MPRTKAAEWVLWAHQPFTPSISFLETRVKTKPKIFILKVLIEAKGPKNPSNSENPT